MAPAPPGPTEPYDDSRGARPAPGVSAPAGCPVGHMGAVGIGCTSESMCTYGYGLHWRCPSIHEVSAVSRRQLDSKGDECGVAGAAGAPTPPPNANGAAGASAPAAAACSTAAGAARLELLARMEQLEARRKNTSSSNHGATGNGGAASSAVGAPAAVAAGVVGGVSGSAALGARPTQNAAGCSVPASGAVGGASGGGGASLSISANEIAQRALAGQGGIDASQSSPSSRRCSVQGGSASVHPMPRSHQTGSCTSSPAGAARSVANAANAERLSCSAGPTDTRMRTENSATNGTGGARGDGATRRSGQGWHGAAPDPESGGVHAPAEADADGWRVSGCWGFFSGGSAPSTRVRHTPPPQGDPWWVSRRQLNQLSGPAERRRCTPPAGGFSLMPGAGSESGAPAVAVSGMGRERPSAGKQPEPVVVGGASTLQTLQGSRLHSLPLRARTQGRGH
jgi:hypothetical protein